MRKNVLLASLLASAIVFTACSGSSVADVEDDSVTTTLEKNKETTEDGEKETSEENKETTPEETTVKIDETTKETVNVEVPGYISSMKISDGFTWEELYNQNTDSVKRQTMRNQNYDSYIEYNEKGLAVRIGMNSPDLDEELYLDITFEYDENGDPVSVKVPDEPGSDSYLKASIEYEYTDGHISEVNIVPEEDIIEKFVYDPTFMQIIMNYAGYANAHITQEGSENAVQKKDGRDVWFVQHIADGIVRSSEYTEINGLANVKMDQGNGRVSETEWTFEDGKPVEMVLSNSGEKQTITFKRSEKDGYIIYSVDVGEEDTDYVFTYSSDEKLLAVENIMGDAKSVMVYGSNGKVIRNSASMGEKTISDTIYEYY